MFRVIVVFCSLFIFTTAAHAQNKSVLGQMPFGMVIGKTTNGEIETRGMCLAKSGSKCKRFDVAGNFWVSSSESEVVNKIIFSKSNGNTLPKKWRALGIWLQKSNKRYIIKEGTLHNEFIKIIKKEGVLNIETTESDLFFVTNFEIGNLFYKTVFYKKESADDGHAKGLSNVTITESY